MIVERNSTNSDRATIISQEDGALRALLYGGLPFFNSARILHLLGHTGGAEEAPVKLDVSNSTIITTKERLERWGSEKAFFATAIHNLLHGPYTPDAEEARLGLVEYISGIESPSANFAQNTLPALPRPSKTRGGSELAGRPSRQIAGRVPLRSAVLPRAASFRR